MSSNLKNTYSKNDNNIHYGKVETVWNVGKTKILKYQQEIMHQGLKEHKILSAPETYILENKVRMQVSKWSERWEIFCKNQRTEDIKKASIEEAMVKTKNTENELSELENILSTSLYNNPILDWELLKNNENFDVPYPSEPNTPEYLSLPTEPCKNDSKYQPKLNILTTLFKSLKTKAIEEKDLLYSRDFTNWKEEVERITNVNDSLTLEYESILKSFNEDVEKWRSQEVELINNQNYYNSNIDKLKTEYFSSDKLAIIEHSKIILDKSPLPSFIDKEFEIDYNIESKILIVDYMLPSIEDFPSLKEVKFIASKNELKEVHYNKTYLEKLFDSTIYKLILRIIYELFQADEINALDVISLNGWINYVNKATGIPQTACIASIQVKKDEFTSIGLKNVDAKACFKNLKGIGSSKLAGITPIHPILTIDKNDKRFIQSHDVAYTLNESTNIAAIPWEEFEHLIREIFEKEFSINGGEVKVTQASRDGGVDAIAFDPDPIRGGKIVIQAKRYTNTVGVSAVRDLYGTIMNEGATKGILVTTADYGPDAYEFAKNKPITLLNGGNLLILLEKHGHKAKIDLKEAKSLNQDNR